MAWILMKFEDQGIVDHNSLCAKFQQAVLKQEKLI